LVPSGIEQAKRLGLYLKDHGLLPTKIYTSTLQRTIQTAHHAQEIMGISLPLTPLTIFDEIDYGVDENQIEEVVVTRLGQKAIDEWNSDGKVPNGWKFDPENAIENWQDFANSHKQHNEVILIVTSNGIARFAPHITNEFEGFKKHHPLKLSTGAFGIIEHQEGQWTVQDWNIKP